jgi:hypothetical protein
MVELADYRSHHSGFFGSRPLRCSVILRDCSSVDTWVHSQRQNCSHHLLWNSVDGDDTVCTALLLATLLSGC